MRPIDLDDVLGLAAGRLDSAADIPKHVGDLRLEGRWQFARPGIAPADDARHHNIADPAHVRGRVLMTEPWEIDAFSLYRPGSPS